MTEHDRISTTPCLYGTSIKALYKSTSFTFYLYVANTDQPTIYHISCAGLVHATYTGLITVLRTFR